MKKLTVAEYSKFFNIPESTVRYNVKTQKLAAIKEMVEGRETTIILVQDEDISVQDFETNLQQVNKDLNANLAANLQQVEKIQQESVFTESNIELMKFLQQMYSDNKQLAAEAGQVKLLEISENSTKQQYFELQQDYKKVYEEKVNFEANNKLLQTLNQKLTEENETHKQKVTQLEVELKISEMKIKELEDNFQPFQDQIKKFQSDNIVKDQQLKDLQVKIYELQEAIKENDRIFDHKLREKDTEITKLANDKISIENELRKSETSYQEVKTNLLNAESIINKVNSELDVKEKQAQELLTIQDTLKNQISDLKQNISEIVSKNEKEVKEFLKTQDQLEDSVTKYEIEYKAIQEKCQTLEYSNKKLQEQIAKLEEEKNELLEQIKQNKQKGWSLSKL